MYKFVCLFLIFISTESGFGYSKSELLKPLVVLSDNSENDDLGYKFGPMEITGEKMVMSIIKEGNTVFDIGAHSGEWNRNALSIQPNITIFAFEPIPNLIKTLHSNFMNKPVSIYQLALSNENGTARFVHYPKLPELSTLHQRPEIEKRFGLTPNIFNVETIKLDTFCSENGISHIDFIKIDTEGNEWKVLLGAQDLLERQAINAIQFEYGGCNLDSKTTLEMIYKYLTSYGYSIYRISSKGLIEIPHWKSQLENYRWCNYIAINQAG